MRRVTTAWPFNIRPHQPRTAKKSKWKRDIVAPAGFGRHEIVTKKNVEKSLDTFGRNPATCAL
jgi:hypothetical protein